VVADDLLELGGLGIFSPERQRLPKPPARLLERPAVRVAAAKTPDAGDPRAALVAFENDSIVATLHRSHFFPRHGSRSRSIARSNSPESLISAKRKANFED
jgi:hypothetical protein